MPSKVSVTPNTSDCLPRYCRQKSSLIITTAGPPGLSSSAAKFRPRTGGRPRTEKKFDVTCAAVLTPLTNRLYAEIHRTAPDAILIRGFVDPDQSIGVGKRQRA